MGGNGGETIRVGVGNNSRTFGYNVIEYNLFEGMTQAEMEIVSNKSYYNTYRYNTFKNCNGGLTLRMGKYCSVYGNFFINDDPTKTGSYGIRIIDKGHKVYNNYCEGLLGASGSLTSIRCPIITYNGTYPSADSLNPLVLNGAYLPADSALIANNTIVNCGGGAGIKLGNYDAGLALNQPLGTTIANNVIKMSSGQAIYKEPSDTLLTYFAEGNMYSAPTGLGFTNTTGFANTTLSFGSRVNGVLPPPAVVQDASLNTANYLVRIGNLDAQGQIRSSIFDAGCDEINGTGMVSNFPLDSNAVGAGKPIIILRSQTISFAAIPTKVVNATPDFSPGATSTSGLAITYISSNPAVATIVNNNIHIVGYGTSVITANQSGNSVFSAAIPVTQTLTVTGISQSISFPAIVAKVVGDVDFAPGATASSGLAVTYTSSNIAVATIVNNNIHIVGAGTAVITAAQNGNPTYYAATNVAQTLTVTKTFTYVPSSTTILSGSLNSGAFGNLATNNTSYYVVNSTTTGTRIIDWYGAVTITQSPATITKLIVNYDGKNSASKTQILYLYNWITASWVQIDSRSVSTTDVTITNSPTTFANYISSAGQIRMRVYSTGGTANYTCSGDWMQFQIQSTSAAKGGVEILPSQYSSTTLELFPNPSNQYANLHYTLTEDSKVFISLFDVSGKKIKTILNNELQLSGDRLIQFDNNGLAKGIYFVKVMINNKISNIKMLIK